MSRGGWILLIGGVVLLVGIGLFAFATAGFFPTLESTNLSPGDFLNTTVDVSVAGSVLFYLVEIQDFASGDALTVFIQTPSSEGVQRTTVDTAGAFTPSPPYTATEPGLHTVVIQNAAARSLSISSSATEVDPPTQILLAAGTLLGFAGFIVLIVGLILWIIDRGRRRRQSLAMPPPPT